MANLCMGGLGGAIGGVLTPFLGPTATSFISGVSSSFLSMGLSDITGMSFYSLSTIVGTSLLIGFACGMTAGLIDNLKMPGINSGRGSLSAISKQINTKFINGTIKHISLTTFEKTALLIAVYSTPFAFFMDFLLMGLFCAKIIREAI